MSSISIETRLSVEDLESEFIPILRSGGGADVGVRSSMEDVYVCVDNFMRDYGIKNFNEEPNAFYGVFSFPAFYSWLDVFLHCLDWEGSIMIKAVLLWFLK